MFTRTIAVTVATDNSAAELNIAVISRPTPAFSRVVGNIALSMWSADVREQTRVDAVVIDTGPVGRTLGIAPTLDAVTAHVRVTLVAWLA